MNKVMIVFFLVLSALFVGCTPSESAVQTAIAQTQAASMALTPQFTLVPTTIPLADIDLESILLREGDLLKGFEGQQIKDSFPGMLAELNKADGLVQVKSQGLVFEGWGGDGITVGVFETPAFAENALKDVIYVSDDTKIENLGELSKYKGVFDMGNTSAQVFFTRCNAVVYIDIYMPAFEDTTKDTLMTYAKRVDKRIQDLICP